MTNSSNGNSLPIGLDLGSATTIGATVDGNTPRLLELDGDQTVSTRLTIGEGGFTIGEEGAETGNDTFLPLPYLEDNARSMTASPSDVPLTLFLRLLRERWEENLTPQSTGTHHEPYPGEETATGDISDLRSETIDNEPSDEPPKRAKEPAVTENLASSGEGDSATQHDDPFVDQPPEEETADPPHVSEAGDSKVQFSPTTIAVPGGYSAADVKDVEEAAVAAGFEDVQVLRNPVAVAGAAATNIEAARTLAVADIGSVWESYAIITVEESGQLNVEARTARSDGGRNEIDEAVARWVLGQVEKEYDVTLSCDEETMEQIREVAHEALNEIDPNGETVGTVELELKDGVEVTEGGLLVSDGIKVDVELDLPTVYRQALKKQREGIQSTVGDLLGAADVDEVDELILAGDGNVPGPVSLAVEKSFDMRPSELALGDRHTTNALGAAVLADRRASNAPTIGRETLTENVEIRALGPAGVENRSVSDPSDSPGDQLTAILTRSSEEQVSGGFEIVHRHRLIDRIAHTSTLTCSNLPNGADDPEITFSITSDPSSLDGLPLEVTGTVPDEEFPELVIDSVDNISIPWLAHTDVDRAELPDSEGTGVRTYEHQSEIERGISELDKEGVARAVWTTRKKLWGHSIKEGEDLSAEQLGMLLREFDRNLERNDIEIIEPEVGSKVDASRHAVKRATESESETETILEVLSLGFAVDGKVVEPAQVEAAK